MKSGWNIDYFTSSSEEMAMQEAMRFMRDNVNALKQEYTTTYDSEANVYVCTVMYLLP